MKRTPIAQQLHDRVIEVAGNNLWSYNVYKNPGTQKLFGIGNLYPDIILTNKQSNVIEFIIEVETESSITPQEAVTQWSLYSKLPGSFYILVPYQLIEPAKRLCQQYSIQATVGAFYQEPNGRIVINY